MFKLEEVPNSSEKLFEDKKRKCAINFALQNRDAIKLYQEHGLLPKSEGWDNVAKHCLVEAAAADTLANSLHLDAKEKEKVVKAAFYHDFFKRRSIEMMKAEKEKISQGLPGNVAEADIKSGELSKEILKNKNVDPEIISILSNSLGYDSIKNENAEKMTTLEKILHYLDSITLDENLVSLKERIDMCKERYPQVRDDKKLLAIYGQPTYDQQYEVGSKIEQELAGRIGLEDPKKLPQFLKDKLTERINATELAD
jgi:HD superfamily phosphohydrolase YqeK